jgi:hypothetical protein
MSSRTKPWTSRRWVGVGAVTCSILLLAIAGSAVGGAVKTKSKTTAIPDDGSATATAKCKRGEKVVSGGFDADFDSNDTTVVLFESRKTGGRKWTASAGNRDTGSAQLNTFAYCSESLGGLKTRSAQTTIPESFFPDASSGTATATCKKGERVVSGGFDGPYDPTAASGVILPYESRKQGRRRWTVSATSYGQGAGTLTALAYCSESVGRLKTKSRSTTLPAGKGFDIDSVSAQCKQGQKVISGGFDSEFGSDFFSEPQILPFVSRKHGGRKWTVVAFDNAFGSGDLTAYAYCWKP